MLCQRIKEVSPKIIDQIQGAFIKESELLYNVLICQDVTRGYQRKSISLRYIMKIDLQKAFNSVHWGFLQEMLTTLKFLLQFIKWVMACVTSVHFSIHINRQESEAFEGRKGLRKGNPLSPLLFVISME